MIQAGSTTFEPQGGVFGYRLKPKQWDDIAKTAEMAFLWPLQENRAPGTVMLVTLLGILIACITARRGWRWNPNAAIFRGLRPLATLAHRMGEGLGVRAAGVERAGMRADHCGRDEFHRVRRIIAFVGWTNDQGRGGTRPYHDVEIVSAVLTPRQRRWFIQPLWRQSLSVLLIVALMLATNNTDVHAAIPNPIFYYHVGDHLGSSNLVTDRNGALVQHREYWAFGQQRVRSESAQDYVFNRYTGQIFDDETGLYYYGARYYDPELGRFIQPDTIVPDPSHSQSLNRYTYVNNNPLKYVDPSGHDPATVIAIAVIVGVVLGAASAAAQGANGQGIALAALAGGLGGLFGGVGAYAGGVIGAAAGSTGAGAFVGAVAGGAVGGAVGAAVTGGNIGMGALTGAISGAIAFGVSQAGYTSPQNFQEQLWNGVLASVGGAAGGATGAAITGGDAGLGAAYGAAGAAIGYAASAGILELSDNQAPTGGGKNSAYETVSLVVEPASVDKFGHSGIAFPGTDEYYDYGPQAGKGAKPWGSRGQSWWKSQADSPTWSSVQKYIGKMQASGDAGTVFVVSLDVSPSQAQAIRSYWKGMEASGGTYRWFSRQCTTTAAASLRAGGLPSGQPLTPSRFLSRALQLRSTSGPHSGVPMSRATILQP